MKLFFLTHTQYRFLLQQHHDWVERYWGCFSRKWTREGVELFGPLNLVHYVRRVIS